MSSAVLRQGVGLAGGLLGFAALAAGFFLLNQQAPLTLLLAMFKGAFGDGFAWSETLVKATPILLTALAVALPARLGLISVGGGGQMILGAIGGTAVVLALPDAPAWLMLPLMLLGAALGGAFWGFLPGVLKARFAVNETISTLLLNYIAALFLQFLIYGVWKDPASLNWPASPPFPEAAILPTFFGTRVHLGLPLGMIAAILLYLLLGQSRWGIGLKLLRDNPRAAQWAGFDLTRNVLLVMSLGGMLAGIAGIAEASVIQGRLQDGLAAGYGISGFLVAWLARHHLLAIIPVAIGMGGLLASADALQLDADLPAASAQILQGLLFMAVLTAHTLSQRRRAAHG